MEGDPGGVSEDTVYWMKDTAGVEGRIGIERVPGRKQEMQFPVTGMLSGDQLLDRDRNAFHSSQDEAGHLVPKEK